MKNIVSVQPAKENVSAFGGKEEYQQLVLVGIRGIVGMLREISTIFRHIMIRKQTRLI